MALLKVYSRDIIGHLFTVIDSGREIKIEIKGINSWALDTSKFNADIPFCNEIDDQLFAKIVDKYKSHLKLFGGKDTNGRQYDAKIFVAKSENEARKKFEDSEPLSKSVGEFMVSKTKGLEVVKHIVDYAEN